MTTTTPPATPARILIVDDEVAQMTALCDTLHDHGYETAGYTNGEAGLAALRETRFDLLLTDLMMPGMDGIALLRAAHELDPHLVGIVMTGRGTIDTAVAAMQAGALDYILKPFKLSVILPVLARALTVRQLRVENAALQQRIRERTAELEAANRELDSFASSVAHDLNAPVRHIAGFSKLILNHDSASLLPETQRHLRTIADAAQRMGQLITDLLAFSRLSRSEMRRGPVNLNDLVRQARDELQPDMRDRAIEWKLAELPTVPGDESMLRQVILNLLSNAIKYTRQRTPAKIEIGRLANENGAEVIFVRDNGAGFNPRYAERLFGMFQRLHREQEFEGVGVGLANARRIIERHRGRIWAEAEVDQGATFYFTLPAA